MGRLLLVWRLVAGSLRRRPVEAVLSVVAIMAATTTLTLALALYGVTDHPYQTTRAATSGPDIVAMPASNGPVCFLLSPVLRRAIGFPSDQATVERSRPRGEAVELGEQIIGPVEAVVVDRVGELRAAWIVVCPVQGQTHRSRNSVSILEPAFLTPGESTCWMPVLLRRWIHISCNRR